MIDVKCYFYYQDFEYLCIYNNCVHVVRSIFIVRPSCVFILCVDVLHYL